MLHALTPTVSRSLTLVAFATLAYAPNASGQQLINLGSLPGSHGWQPRRASADGSVIVGTTFSNVHRALRWEAREYSPATLIELPSLGSGIGAIAHGVSDDGSTTVGNTFDDKTGTRAVYWLSNSTLRVLPPLSSSPQGMVFAANGNGTVLVGEAKNAQGDNHAVRWSLSNGGYIPLDLGRALGYRASAATDVSDDGSVIVGCNHQDFLSSAFKWTSTLGMVPIGTLLGSSEASAVSGDGRVIVGSSVAATGWRAFRWVESDDGGGTMQDLGVFSGAYYSFAYGVSSDGSMVVGECETPTGSRACMWDHLTGMVDLNLLLPTFGIDLTGWVLKEAWGISGDGFTVIGSGTYNGVPAAWAAVIDADTDQDGLRDSWERLGVPYTDSGGILRRYLLDSDVDGVADAHWLQKDIFVEVDAMTGRAPSATTLQRVIDAFNPKDRTLVPAVPGVEGALSNVRLHIQTDVADLGLTLTAGGDYTRGINGFEDFAADKARYFGSARERNSSHGSALLEAKRKVYRYCIFANTYGGTSSSGVAEGIPSDDFMITLGRFPTPGGTPDEQAATFMHELGHALGLRHGGVDDLHWKPNYYSVMNYWWQLPKPWQGSAWALRYSEAPLHLLDERALSEVAGIGAALPGVRVPYRVPTNSSCDGHQCYERVPSVCYNFAALQVGAWVDWNGDCEQTVGILPMDINDFSALLPSNASPQQRANHGLGLTELEGCHDWLRIHYNFRTSETHAPGAPAEPLDCDYDLAVYSFLSSIPAACAPDVNNDGVLNTQDLFDFLGTFLVGMPGADFNGNGVVNSQDFFDFLEAFFAGC
jgi:uncharacterized membrane protein